MALTKLTKNLIDGTIVTSVNGSSGAVTLETGTDWQTTIQTSNFTAVASKGYFVNTTSAAITVTLPAGVVGTEIVIQDYAGTFANNKVIFASNGSEKIQGTTNDFECVTNNATVTLIYQDATKGWTADNIVAPLPPLTVNYLVVAGGGGGGCANGGGGGGGAGGYRTNYGGTALTLLASTNYNISVGAGGAGGSISGNGQKGVSGSNSAFSSITSRSGGYGGGDNSRSGGEPGGASGSGGGGARSTGTNSDAFSAIPQGSGGGSGYGNTGGGGGGAGGAGAAATSSTGGNGGIGLQNAITVASGTGPYYAGGGGGGIESPSSASDAGSGGSGVGGTGGAAGSVGAAPTSGTNNTGGGGGGSGDYNSGGNYPGQNGGSGIVILRYPGGYIISGLSGTTTTVGTDSVTTFTSGTGNIQFN